MASLPNYFERVFTGLQDRGLPDDVSRTPIRFWHTSRRSLLHTTDTCHKLARSRPTVVELDFASAYHRNHCRACCQVFWFDKTLPNGMSLGPLKMLIEAWDVPRSAHDKRIFDLTLVADSLRAVASDGTPEVAAIFGELAERATAEIAATRAAKDATAKSFAATGPGRLAFAVSALYGAGTGAADLLARYGLRDESRADWLYADQFAKPLLAPIRSGSVTDLDGVRDRVAGEFIVRYGAPPDDTSNVQLTGEFGRLVAAHMASRLSPGQCAHVHQLAVESVASAAAELAQMVADEVAGEVAAFAERFDDPASGWAFVHVVTSPGSPAHRDLETFVELASARFDSVVDAGGAVTLLMPAAAAPQRFAVAGGAASSAACPAGFTGEQAREALRVFAHLDGAFAQRFVAAVGLVD